MTYEDFENELQKIIDDNIPLPVDNYNIGMLREEFRKVILKAQHFNIDISNMFPIVAEYDYNKLIKYNYNGSVIMTE